TATVRRRSRLPEPVGEALAEVLRPLGENGRVVRFDVDRSSWKEVPEGERKPQGEKGSMFVLSKPWEDLVADLYSRHGELLGFLRKELDVPQGEGGTNFIDPVPVLNAVLAAREALVVPSVDPRLSEKNGFWLTRFAAMNNVES